jgi:adenylate cyclase
MSLRASLVLGFGSLLLLTAGGIVLNTHLTARKVIRTLSTSLLEMTTGLVELKLDAFFGVLGALNTGTTLRIEAGLVPWGDWEALHRYLRPTLERFPQISGAGAGDSAGNAWNLVSHDSGWRAQEIRPADWGIRTLWKEWDATGQLTREWWEESEFDPRTRPWFRGAAAANRPTLLPSSGVAPPMPHWTTPYRFFTTGDYGVTVATRVRGTHSVDAVVYFDLTLRDLDAFAHDNKPSSNGFTIVMNDDLDVVAWPGRGELSRDNVLGGERRITVAADRLPLLAASLKYWRQRGGPDAMIERFEGPADHVWLALRTLRTAGDTFHVLTVVPEDDLLGAVRQERQHMAMVLGGALVGAVLLALWLAGLYTRPIALLVERSHAIQRLELGEQKRIPSRLAEVRLLADAQSSMSAALESFSRYVPREIIGELLRRGEAAKIGAHPAKLTVMFSDIRRFTAISEHLPPDDIARHLSEYFDALHEIIARHRGTTDKFIGDALMAFWGAPRSDEQHAVHAIEAALDCCAALDQLNQQWRAAGRPELETTFGLATGPVVVGNVGARARLNYTVLGSTVNLASRCVGLGRNLGCSVLAAESVLQATAGRLEWRRVGPVQVKGLIKPVLVCEPLGRVGQVEADRLAFRDAYEAALDRYLARDFAVALPAAEALKEEHPRDLSVAFLERRCRELMAEREGEVHTTLLLFGRDPNQPEMPKPN